MRLRALAQGRDCQVRLPVCNGNPETTILAHFRLIGLSGMGLKNDDALGAWACSACHAWVDTHKDCQTQLDFAKGVLRTLYTLRKEGELR